MLDLTGIEVPERPELKHLIAQSARTIENAMLLQQKHGLRDIEAEVISKAIAQARGNVAQAARALGISRATMYRKLGSGKPRPH